MIPPRCSAGNSNAFPLQAEQHWSREPTIPSTGMWMVPPQRSKISARKGKFRRSSSFPSILNELLATVPVLNKASLCWAKHHESDVKWTQKKGGRKREVCLQQCHCISLQAAGKERAKGKRIPGDAELCSSSLSFDISDLTAENGKLKLKIPHVCSYSNPTELLHCCVTPTQTP